MADIRIMKAVEFSKLPVKFRKQYSTAEALHNAGWWLQPKYDGCYAEFHVDRRTRTVTANTRTGELIRSADHISKHLYDVTAAGGAAVYVGELWCPDTNVLFPKISGWVRQHAPEPRLTFKAFDTLPPGLETTELYQFRMVRLMELVGTVDDERMVSCVPHNIYNRKLHELTACLKAQGKYDGTILRNPIAGYKIGLVKAGEIVKVKPVLSLDLLVTQVFTDVGEKTGRAVYSIEVVYNGVLSKVGSGVPHDRSEVPNSGQIAEVECMAITADGKLREPRFKSIRHDKEMAD